MKKCGRDRQTTDDYKIWHMRIACWITKAADTHTKYAFHGSNAPVNTPQYYVNTYIACLVRMYLNTHSDFH